MLVPASRVDKKKSKQSLKMSLIKNDANNRESATNTTTINIEGNSGEELKSKSSSDTQTPIINNLMDDIILDDTHQDKYAQNGKTNNNNRQNNGFTKQYNNKCVIKQIAPNQKGNFISSLCIDELNGWLVAGQCSGTVIAWKLPTNDIDIVEMKKNNKEEKTYPYECRKLIECEEDSIRHIYNYDDHVICMVGYRRLIEFVGYDINTCTKQNLGCNDVFTYSPFASPHMFYSMQYDNMVHIFCRSFGCALQVDFKTHKKQVNKLTDTVGVKTYVLTCNDNNCIWQTLKTKYAFWENAENLCKNKKQKQWNINGNKSNNNNNKNKWYNKMIKKNSYVPPTLKKIQIRALETLESVNNCDYFEPLPHNAWGFQLDNMSLTMAYVCASNKIKIISIYSRFEKDKRLLANDDDCDNHHNLANALTLQSRINSQSTNININNNNDGDDGDDGDDKEVASKELYRLNGHSGFVLAIEYKDGILISLATDRKLIVWKNGRKLAVCNNIPGTFIPGYPYIVRKARTMWNKIFYTADNGIFMVVF